MPPLLYLVHRIPFPPNKGDKVRSYHLLQYLRQHYRVFLGAFVDDPADWQHAERVRALCEDAYLAPLDPRRAKLRSLQAFASGAPLSVPYYRDAGFQRWVTNVVQRRQIDTALVFSSPMAQYVSGFDRMRRVADFVDVDSAKWSQYATTKRWPMSWVYRREGRTLLAFERSVARQLDATVFVSPAEAALFRSLAPECADRTHHAENGVDTEYFCPDGGGESPYPAGTRAVVFTGAMDYWPNVDAVRWFAAEVWPGLQARYPGTAFYIVGARPTPAVTALGDLPGVVVTGTVPDIRPYLAHAAVSVAPLRIARGIQNKVLEAMAMARPVVAAPGAFEGIEATPGSELLVAAGAVPFAEAVGTVLDGGLPDMGRLARERVLVRYSWRTCGNRIARLLRGMRLLQGQESASDAGGLARERSGGSAP